MLLGKKNVIFKKVEIVCIDLAFVFFLKKTDHTQTRINFTKGQIDLKIDIECSINILTNAEFFSQDNHQKLQIEYSLKPVHMPV